MRLSLFFFLHLVAFVILLIVHPHARANDGWTILTKDGAPSAHFEHTIAITDNGPKILSVGSNA